MGRGRASIWGWGLDRKGPEISSSHLYSPNPLSLATQGATGLSNAVWGIIEGAAKLPHASAGSGASSLHVTSTLRETQYLNSPLCRFLTILSAIL